MNRSGLAPHNCWSPCPGRSERPGHFAVNNPDGYWCRCLVSTPPACAPMSGRLAFAPTPVALGLNIGSGAAERGEQLLRKFVLWMQTPRELAVLSDRVGGSMMSHRVAFGLPLLFDCRC